MKRIILLFVWVLIFMPGCSDSEQENSYQRQILEEYNILDKFDLDKVAIENKDSIVTFSGKLKNKDEIGLVIFDVKTKKKLIDIIPFENNKFTIDIPYNGESTFTVAYIYCDNLIQNGNITVVHAQTGVYNSDPHSISAGGTSHYFFVKDGHNMVKAINMSGDYLGGFILNWREDFILNYKGDLTLFTSSGTIISKVNFGFDEIIRISKDEILNDYEGVYTNGIVVSRINIKEGIALWNTGLNLNTEGRPRIDNTKLIEKTDTHFTYEVSYTEYSGKKGTIKFKVDIETGVVEYL